MNSDHRSSVDPLTVPPPEPDSLSHRPGGPWEFDQGVVDVFEDMLRRSIPEYDRMRKLVAAVASEFVIGGSKVIDLGTSRGEALSTVRGAIRRRYVQIGKLLDVVYVGVETSRPMVAAARERFAGCDDVEILEMDLTKQFPILDPPSAESHRTSVVLSCFCLQFLPITARAAVLDHAYRSLISGGALILAEKVQGDTAGTDKLLVGLYHALKAAQGYEKEEIVRKAASLEGVLSPLTAKWNEDALRSAGFATVECFWRSLNFAAWVAVK